jgi:precorrin-6B methylase 2
MSIQTLREFITRQSAAQTSLAVLGATLDAHATGTALDPALAARATELLEAVGLREPLADVSTTDAAQFLAELRQAFAIDSAMLYAASRGTAWGHDDPRLLQAAGDFSRGFARGLTKMVIPALDGLAARFAAPDAAFLDIGVGVAGIALELASAWPRLRITGIDVWQPSLALARANVAAAGLGDSIELREQGAESLRDEQAFDLAWLPLIFIPQSVAPAAMERALHALRPGGWLVAGFANIEAGDATSKAIWRLRTTTFGGPLWTVPEVEARLRTAGFVDVKLLPTPPGAPALLAARRTQ